MDKLIQNHQKEILDILKKDDPKTNWKHVLRFHKRFIDYFQMERLIHLIVTMSVGLFTLVLLVTLVFKFNIFVCIACLLLLCLLVPYLFYYYKLENGVQKLYPLDKQLEEKL